MSVQNPFTDIHSLNYHTDFVRFLLTIDSNRCCSAGDDGLVIIWDAQCGRLLHVLKSHCRPIAVILPLKSCEEWKLLTSSSDKQICLWNVDSGSLLKTFTDHNSTAKCLILLPLYRDHFCSGGEKICLWDLECGLVDVTFPPHLNEGDTSEDVHLLLLMKDDIIIAAIDTHLVVVSLCNNEEGKLKLGSSVKQFESHRESIRCLTKINDDSFVSGSIDGAIIHWSVETWTAIQQYNVVDNYLGQSRIYPYSIQCMVIIEKKFLLAAQGSGFNIYDLNSRKLILGKPNAHESKVLHLELVYDGHLLATCSEDASIKLWTCRRTHEPSKEPSDRFSKGPLSRFAVCLDAEIEGSELYVDLIGECLAHSGPVLKCLNVPPNRFLSCGDDKRVILWKDGFVERCKRDRMIRDALYDLDQLKSECSKN